MVRYERVIALLKCLLAAYVATGLMLAFLAALLYKLQLNEDTVEIGIIVVYVVSSLLAGLFFSKGARSRRFLWGMAAGAAYFLIICAVSVAMEPEFAILSNSCLTTMAICVGSGMLGGMLG